MSAKSINLHGYSVESWFYFKCVCAKSITNEESANPANTL